MAEKLEMKSMDMTQENIRRIQALFPNVVTEVIKDGKTQLAVDFDALKEELSAVIIEGKQERYQMTWPEKSKAKVLAAQQITATLRPCKEESVDFDTTKNLYIEGDNLDVLKLLQETYLGKVKMIYIDPPYNTGNDFVYCDNFSQSADAYASISGDYDEQGNKLFKNTDANGRFHTDWLNMMYPRLRIAKDLLTDDGAIFISIDENEVNTLKSVCDEIFGQSNFVAELVWAAGRKNDSKYISISHEYILVYFKSLQYIQEHQITWREKKRGLDDIYAEYERLKKEKGNDYKAIEVELKRWYKNLPDGHPAKDHAHYNRVDANGIFFADNISWPGGGGPKYELLHPSTGKPVKIPSRGWLTNAETMKLWIEQGRVEFGVDESYVPTLKSYLKDREDSVPYSVFYKDGRASSKRLAALMGDKVFENPKDEEIIQRIIEFCGLEDNDIILDFFSGSATTAHAVFLANMNQGKTRRFILVQLPEEINLNKANSERGKKVAQSAINLLNLLGVKHTICEIGKERIRRAGKKVKADNGDTASNLDIGFRVLKLDSSNMQDVYYHPTSMPQSLLDSTIDNIKPDRTPMDLLFQVMLSLGIELSAKIEEKEVAGKKYYVVNNGALIACFDDDINNDVITEIAKLKPVYAVFRDKSFANDSVGINNEQLFKTYSPSTIVKVI